MNNCQEEAVAFAEWIGKNYTRSITKKQEGMYYEPYAKCKPDGTVDYKSLTELYQIFKSGEEKQP